MEIPTTGISTDAQSILLFIIVIAEVARIIMPIFVKTETCKKHDCEEYRKEIKNKIDNLDERLYSHVTEND